MIKDIPTINNIFFSGAGKFIEQKSNFNNQIYMPGVKKSYSKAYNQNIAKIRSKQFYEINHLKESYHKIGYHENLYVIGTNHMYSFIDFLIWAIHYDSDQRNHCKACNCKAFPFYYTFMGCKAQA